ncbi:MAG TPA: primosomal protein N' [Candidatus Baltobacteraceae bacterium]|nr:primosomal protein N' [Candidatus Baltobacteraceae bacterium]
MIAAIRSSRFDMPLTYDAGEHDVQIGDVVRVPLGSREQLAFVISAPELRDPGRSLRALTGVTNVPRAFDEMGLALARFVADEYLCTLGEALGAVVLAAAVPRTVDSFVPAVDVPVRTRYPSVPGRLVDLIWGDLREGFGMEQLLRHPEARRAGDRGALLRHIGTIVRSGELQRTRRFVDPRMHEYRIRVLYPGSGTLRGPKMQHLLAFVNEQPGVPRADALLAGFSNATIARAVKSGALREAEETPTRDRSAAGTLPTFTPTGEQRAAIDTLTEALSARAFAEILLHGITGSGKTFVYIHAIARVLAEGGRAIVLVPEISLTPQTARRFEQAFGGRVAVLHSALSERERFDAWTACAQGEIDVVVGARSAVFAPLRDVRLLIVDESHESSYRQESVPRYHAVAVARERMRLENGVLVLGSATPSLESYADAIDGRIALLELHERATQQPLPHVTIVDMGKEFEAGNRRIFSSALAQALDERMQRGEKTVLFVNRRGTAGFLLCRKCGFVPECPRCSVSLTLHRSEGAMRCHYCDFQRGIPQRCERCSSDAVREFGAGTERVAEEVQHLYPSARVVRMDSDTTTRIGDHARLLDEFGENGDVLVGTQMVAKGLDFPTVTLVGVVAADIGLHAPDFRASERTFGLVTQVCGRSGRARAGEAIVQTYSPTHPALTFAANHDYRGFALHELEERRSTQFPPASALLYAGVIGRERKAVLAQAQVYARKLEALPGIDVLGPAPYPIARLNNEWRFRIALKGERPEILRSAVRDEIQPLARADRATRLVIVVNP